MRSIYKNMTGCFMAAALSISAVAQQSDYLILASDAVKSDPNWNKVVSELQKSHPNAQTLFYGKTPADVFDEIKSCYPRYVAVVEKPENIGKDFVIGMNRLSREVDDDIYMDFLWGMISGYDAGAAIRVVRDAQTPKRLPVCLTTISDLGDGKWFDIYCNIADNKPGYYRTKYSGETIQTEHRVTDTLANNMYARRWYEAVKRYGSEKNARARFGKNFSVDKPNLLQPFDSLYRMLDPDLMITASHATENNLEMPFSAGNILCKDGYLYADYPQGPSYFDESNKCRVYLPIGNCLIGNTNNTKNSMSMAWMKHAKVSTFVGYVVVTWYGRNGWGGLRTLLTQPGRYTVAESFYLNQQDLLYRLQENAPDLVGKPFPYDKKENLGNAFADAEKTAGRKVSMDEMGQWYDRDVLAYYGDPLWNVRLNEIPEENDITVTCKQGKGKCTVTIKTGRNFDLKRMEGSNLNKENLQPMPFSYFFPERLENPRLAEGQDWKAAVDENFLFLYDTHFEPGKTYKIVLQTD